MSTLYVDNLEPNLGSRVMAAGHVVQVLQANKTDVFTAGLSSTFVGIPDLSVTITPTSTSSKILIMPTVFISSNYTTFYHFQLYRNGTIIDGARGDASGSRARDYGMFYISNTGNNNSHNMSLPPYLDSPNTTSATTYQLYVGDQNNGGSTFYLNRSQRDGTQVYEPRGISTFTVMEIAQ